MIGDPMVRSEHDTHRSSNLNVQRFLNRTHLRNERFELS
jgi:hypothetical protein